MATHTSEKAKDARIEVPNNEGSNSKDFTVKSQNSMSLPLDPSVSDLNFNSGSDNFTDFRASSELQPPIITNSQNGGAKPKVPKLLAPSNQNLFGTSFQNPPKLVKINKVDKTNDTMFDPKGIEQSLLFLKQDLNELRKNKIPNCDHYQKYTSDKLEILNKQIQNFPDLNVSKDLQSKFDRFEIEQCRTNNQIKNQLETLTNKLSYFLESNSKSESLDVCDDSLIPKTNKSEKVMVMVDHPGMDEFDYPLLEENDLMSSCYGTDFVQYQHGSGNSKNHSFSHPDDLKNREDEYDLYPFLKSLPKMERYIGTTNWDDYYHQFMRYAFLANWNAQDKLDALHLCLGGSALHYYETLNMSTKNNFDSLIAAMARRFGPEIPPEAQRAKFQNLSRNEKESLRVFADRVRTTAIQAYPNLKYRPCFNEQFLVDAFLKGVNYPEAAIHNLNQDHQTLEAALHGVQMYIENVKIISKKLH